MKAITFLGMQNYQKVTYVWKDHKGMSLSCETDLFPEALANIFQPKQLYVFVTEKVHAHQNFLKLKQRLGNKMTPVVIPTGKSEDELWQIFDHCSSVINAGDSVLLDITHAFRSIPLVVFTAALYLRRTKKLKDLQIIYGAFEAKDDHNRAPIFDLTLLIELIEWLGEARTFHTLGRAEPLGSHLKKQHQQLRRAGLQPTQLQKVGKSLEDFSLALHFAQPIQAMRQASVLLNQLDQVEKEVEQWAKPFRLILHDVRVKVKNIVCHDPNKLDLLNLSRQLELIRQYVESHAYAQAILLAREWLVSFGMYLKDSSADWLNRSKRQEVEDELGKALKALQKKVNPDITPLRTGWMPKSFIHTWGWIVQLRNDLAHCGMNPQAGENSPENLQRKAKEIPVKLQKLLQMA